MIEAIVHWHMDTADYGLYLREVENHRTRAFWALDANGYAARHEVAATDVDGIRPLMRGLGRPMLEAIGAALVGGNFIAEDNAVVPATKAHLADAKVTRDRLFALVEKLTDVK